MEYDPPLYGAVRGYAAGAPTRFHMPGHGGRIEGSFLEDVSKYDLTELCETDDLSFPTGVIRRAEELAAKRFSSGATLFSCGGATLCVQAAVYTALTERGGRFFCHRNIHRSAVNAFALLGVQPEWFADFGACDFEPGSIVMFTYEDYYGELADPRVFEKLRERDIFIIADNSHGTHLAFYGGGALHPLRLGADLCIDSPHKTLPVLTGGALLHLRDGSLYETARRGMRLFGSTSPNYLIMSSLDFACAAANGETLDKTLEAINGLRAEFPEYFNDPPRRDPFRVVLTCGDPKGLYDRLYGNSVKCEFADSRGVVLIPPYGAGEAHFEPLKRLLRGYERTPPAENAPALPIPERRLDIRAAVLSPRESVPMLRAAGRIAAREYSPYPPGVPVIVPGEVFTKETAQRLAVGFPAAEAVKDKHIT